MEYGQKNVIFRLDLEFNCKINKWNNKKYKIKSSILYFLM